MLDMKECLKPHPLLHLLSGIGLGLVLVALVPSLVASALTLGIVLVVAGVLGELLFLKK